MHLYHNALYRTHAGNIYRYCGVVCIMAPHRPVDVLRFNLVRQGGFAKAPARLDMSVENLQNPNAFLRNLTLVGRNYVPKK